MIKIIAYYVGEKTDVYHKCKHEGECIVLDGEKIKVIRRCYSTEPKWVPHDLGCERKTNIKSWCRDYDRARERYDKLFGKGNWSIQWSDSKIQTIQQFNEA